MWYLYCDSGAKGNCEAVHPQNSWVCSNVFFSDLCMLSTNLKVPSRFLAQMNSLGDAFFLPLFLCQLPSLRLQSQPKDITHGLWGCTASHLLNKPLALPSFALKFEIWDQCRRYLIDTKFQDRLDLGGIKGRREPLSKSNLLKIIKKRFYTQFMLHPWNWWNSRYKVSVK